MKKIIAQDKRCTLEIDLCLKNHANYKDLGEELLQLLSNINCVEKVDRINVGGLIIFGTSPFASSSDVIRDKPSLGNVQRKLLTGHNHHQQKLLTGKRRSIEEEFRSWWDFSDEKLKTWYAKRVFANVSDSFYEFVDKPFDYLASDISKSMVEYYRNIKADVKKELSLLDTPSSKYGPTVMEQSESAEDRRKPNRNWYVMSPEKRRRKIVLQQSRIATEIDEVISSEDVMGYSGVTAKVIDYSEDRHVAEDNDFEKAGVIEIVMDSAEVMSQENISSAEVQDWIEQNFIPELMSMWNLVSENQYLIRFMDEMSMEMPSDTLWYDFSVWYSPDEVKEWSL